MADVLSDDKRQEANAALLKIDKGLRSSRPGDIEETIVKFPSLIDSYPFPTLINVLFLKLADVFRTGSNLLRLNILKVVQLAEKHISKITSIAEFFRRIYSVMHSNDPIARALTLRMFGAMASLLSEKKMVHHSIQNSLESHDRVEVEAALYATDALCQQSSIFVEGVYVKIADMVLGLSTSPDMKLKAILVFRKMHHSLKIASQVELRDGLTTPISLQVREVCLKVLESHPTLTFISVVLPTLTELSIATLVQAPQQVEVLLGYVDQDVRQAVRHLAMIGLHKLSVKTPQCWDRSAIEKLVKLIGSSQFVTEKEIGCCILYHLSSSIAIQSMLSLEESVRPFCYQVSSPVTRAYATACCCNIIKCEDTLPTTTDDDSAMEVAGGESEGRGGEERVKTLVLLAVDILVTGDFENRSSRSVKVLLGCIGDVVDRLVVDEDLVVTLLSQIHKLPADCYSVLCSTVAAMERNWREKGDKVGVEAVTYQLLQILQSGEWNSLLLPIGRMLLELHSGVYSSGRYAIFTSSVQPLLIQCTMESEQSSRFWKAYKIARRGTKRGFHRMSEEIYAILYPKVNDPKFKKWLQALCQFSQAQCAIADAQGDPCQLVCSLQTASSHLYDSTLLIKFLPCLAGLLDLYAQLLSLCIRYRSLYPPTPSCRDTPLSKFKELAGQFHSTSKHFSSLLHSLFDADPHTLGYIKLCHAHRLQQSCDLVSNIVLAFISHHNPLLSPVQSVGTPISPSVPVALTTTDSFDTRHTLGVVCNRVLSVAQSAGVKLQLLPFSAEHLSVIEESVLSLLDVPFLLPPSFFLSYQSTSVQLALTPPIDSPQQSESVVLGNYFALKVEGVVDHYGKRIYRSPASVLIQVKPHVEKLFDSSYKLPALQELEETVSVKNDYFIAEFLLTLPLAGQYVLKIENSLVDHKGQIWHTGPSVEMNVIVDTEDKLEIIEQQQKRMKMGSSAEGGSGNSNIENQSTSNNTQQIKHW